MRKLIVRISLMAALSILMPSIVIADENAELMSKGMWKDISSGLIWSRCSIGLSWNGNKCIGKAQNFFAPQYSEATTALAAKQFSLGGFSDWRLPTIAELLTLRACRSGMEASIKTIPFENRTELKTFEKCSGETTEDSPSIRLDIFPDYDFKNEAYWATSYANGDGEWWHVYFGYASGFTQRKFIHYRGYVRPVRSPQGFNEAISTLFPKQLEMQKAQAMQKKLAQEQDMKNQMAAQRKYEADQAAAQVAAQKKYENALRSKSPQQMYLAAVKYENDDERGRAKKIYLTIMDRFSSSPVAMKAADRLASLKDVEAVESAGAASSAAAYSVNQRNREQCEKNRIACFSGCNVYKGYSQQTACQNGCPLCAQ